MPEFIVTEDWLMSCSQPLTDPQKSKTRKFISDRLERAESPDSEITLLVRRACEMRVFLLNEGASPASSRKMFIYLQKISDLLPSDDDYQEARQLVLQAQTENKAISDRARQTVAQRARDCYRKKKQHPAP